MPRPSGSTPSLFLRLCDRLTIGGAGALLFLSPLAFGAVHRWAYVAMESTVFLLIAVWMGKLWTVSRNRQFKQQAGKVDGNTIARLPLVALLLFVVVCSAQLMPLPPVLLSYLSPATYALYQRSLPGWPEQRAYEKWISHGPDTALTQIVTTSHQQGTALRTESGMVPNAARVLVAPVVDVCSHCSGAAGEWMPLSLAPALTQVTLLKFLTYISFFCLLLLYPVNKKEGCNAERQFLRTMFVLIVSSGFLIATIAIVQHYFWNGKILWFFVPEHWDSAKPDILHRASGPFVNSDHFANYLVLIIPLLLGGLLSPALFVAQKRRKAFVIFCGATFIVGVVGLLSSLSRGGWVGATIGLVVFCWCIRIIPADRQPKIFPQMKRVQWVSIATGIVVACGLVLLGLGDAGREQIDQRIDATLNLDTGLDVRIKVWQASLGMVRDFPVLGVGLGAWPELFPHYQLPPWSPLQWHEAHNDYLQGLAETGVTGLGLLGWFFCIVVRCIWRGLATVDAAHAPVCAAILAAFAGMAFHESVDFGLQIPANALLFTALLALGLRMVGSPQAVAGGTPSFFPRPILLGSVGALAVGVGAAALVQKDVPYRVDSDTFSSVAEARANILAFPARREGHMALVEMQENLVPAIELRKELEIAVWFAPLDPEIRDQYVVALLEEGQQPEALNEVQQSIFNAPSLASHFYLDPKAIPLLDSPEIQAIDEGLQDALAAGYPGALTGLGDFYEYTNRPSEKARLYEKAALREQRVKWKTRYLLEAGKAHVLAGKNLNAEPLLRQVIQLSPQDPRAYLMLITDVFSVSGDMTAARATAAEGIAHGIEPSTLLLAVAGAAQRAGKREAAQVALQDLIQRQPSSFDAQYRLGVLYLQDKNFSRAALAFAEAARLRSNSAEAFFMLGQAEEAQYHYTEAQKAYTQALRFAAENNGYRQRYEALRKKLQGNGGPPREPITKSVIPPVGSSLSSPKL